MALVRGIAAVLTKWFFSSSSATANTRYESTLPLANLLSVKVKLVSKETLSLEPRYVLLPSPDTSTKAQLRASVSPFHDT